MISPEDLRAKAQKLWDSHKIHRAHLENGSLFPWEIAVPRPTARELADEFPRLRAEVRRLEAGGKAAAGGGYSIEYAQINHRRLGEQSLPRKVVVTSLEDFLHLTGKRRQYDRFVSLAGTILAERPGLKDFLCRKPSTVLDNADDWERLLSVCRYFQKNPKPALYTRQLDIAGVDTKFIETRRAVIAELLGTLLPETPETAGARGLSDHGFERRFGLSFESPLIRFRLLDPAVSFSGLTDLSAPLTEFRRLTMPARRVFVTENKMNGLSFPPCRDALVIFGLGYGVGSLADVPWLHQAELFYWGDIDTHGLAILDQLRAAFPDARSFLMDERTLMLHKEMWGREATGERFSKDLKRLTPEENNLFQALRDDRLGPQIRLEQERIAFRLVQAEVSKSCP